jgi:hypothetical protein
LIRSLLLSLLLAACATSVRAQEAMAPFAPLIGCWRGAFEGNADIRDERCFEPMLDGRFVRDVHHVRPTSYSGETIYFADAQAGGFGFTYYAGNGGLARGVARAVEGGFVFDPHTFVDTEGDEQRLRSTWRFEGPDRLVAVSEREQDGEWRPWGRITYTRAANQ